MSITPVNTTGSPDIQRTRWRIDPQGSSVEFHVRVKRDEHLRSADFVDTANHPQVRFVSRRAQVDGHRLDLQGEWQAAGRSMPIELEGVIRRSETSSKSTWRPSRITTRLA